MKKDVKENPKRFIELSKNFVMVNIMDEPEADLSEHTPDGGYIPRVLFYNPETGAVDTTLYNKRGNPKYKYFYSSAKELCNGMQAVIDKLGVPKEL